VKLQIVELILWPRKAGLAPQVVPFERDKANIITGASKTGKSSIIPIIDYCLGSERCAIPVGVIRKAVAWFGIVVDTDEGLILLARPEPGKQPTSTDMYLKAVQEGKTPLDVPIANTKVDLVKLTMDRLARLTRLGTDAQNTTSGYAGRPSFRDLMAFCFQPQNLVANPDVLFYRADTTEHRQKLRAIFPYVLGVTTPEILEKQWEYESLRKAARVLEKELAAYERASATWRANLGSWVAEAYELGFLPVDSLKDAEC
jgi:hypothetical protein